MRAQQLRMGCMRTLPNTAKHPWPAAQIQAPCKNAMHAPAPDTAPSTTPHLARTEAWSAGQSVRLHSSTY